MSVKIKKIEEFIKESNNTDVLNTYSIKIDKNKVVDKVEKNKIYKIEL
jgi:hypothetical protein